MRWYQSTKWVAFWLLFFFPLGLFLMWRYSTWPGAAKWLLSAVWVTALISIPFQEPRASRASRKAPESSLSQTDKLKEIALRVAVWDDTEKRPRKGKTEVWFRGHGSWFPDLTYKGDFEILGKREAGTSHKLFFYPDGRPEEGGVQEIQLQLHFKSGMCPDGCDRNALHLVIEDSKIRAWGAMLDDAGRFKELDFKR